MEFDKSTMDYLRKKIAESKPKPYNPNALKDYYASEGEYWDSIKNTK